jgi:enoyl-CoA hydratase/carnithine racemase
MKPEESKPPVRVERRGAALWIWIDREERRNAINKGVIAGIAAAVRAAQDDPALRAVVLTGAGRKAFCAGADLTDGAQTFTLGLDEPTTDFGRLARLTRDLGIPLVGRVNGDCVAGGMGLMALCDLVVVADHARFGLPEAKVGVFPMQVLVFLRAMIGARHVNELCLTGELIDAARAREIGIANYVVPFDALDARVEALLARLGEMSPVAMRRGKFAIAAMERMAFPEAMAFAETLISVTALTRDATEGLAAFNERRKPNWIEGAGDV